MIRYIRGEIIAKSIFHAYDVRGIYPIELDENIVYNIAQGFYKYTKAKLVLIGRDTRNSSLSLSERMIAGFLDAGVSVIDLGLCSTPYFYYVLDHLGFKAGCMITASHDPKNYNGIKFCVDRAVAVAGKDLKKVEKISWKMAKKPIRVKEDKIGHYAKVDLTKEYVNHVLSFMKDIDLGKAAQENHGKRAKGKAKTMKVAVDVGNGSTGKVLTKVLSRLKNVKAEKLFFSPNGNFPNHGPNPMLKENLVDLKKTVRRSKANLGAAFDNDGDRIIFVDEKGNKIPAYIITALIAEKFLKENYEGKILYDVRSSRVVPETIRLNNGIPIMSRVGHSFIKSTMRELGIIFGGELSGHYYYQDNNYSDSGVITFILVMDILKKSGKKMSELVRPYNRYYNSGEINYSVQDKKKVMKDIKEMFSEGRSTTIDGLRIDAIDYWISVRESHTEPLLRINIEANSEHRIEELMLKVEKVMMQNGAKKD